MSSLEDRATALAMLDEKYNRPVTLAPADLFILWIRRSNSVPTVPSLGQVSLAHRVECVLRGCTSASAFTAVAGAAATFMTRDYNAGVSAPEVASLVLLGLDSAFLLLVG